MNFRVKGPKNTQTYRQLSKDLTFGEFRALIEKDCNVPKDQQILSFGMPTQTVDAKDETLVSAVLKSGESINLEMAKPSGGEINTNHNGQTNPPSSTQSTNTNSTAVDGVIVKRSVPDDNSCMFHSIAYCLEGNKSGRVDFLRSVIAKAILSDPINYNEGTLQKSPLEYSKFITQPNSWGGSVELAIFAQHYKCEIMIFDIARQRHECFGEGGKYSQRIYLIYDGIHYDPLVCSSASNPQSNKEWDIAIFKPDDLITEASAKAYAEKEYKSGKFVDEYNYSIKCEQCGKVFVGNKNAVAHSNSTGHSRFTQT